MKKVCIVGSTGSIGTQTLNVIRAFPQAFDVVCLIAGRNVSLFSQQISEWKPPFVGIADESACRTLLSSGISAVTGDEIFSLIKACDADIYVIAASGIAGLSYALAAAKTGKRVALANKESMVVAGALFASEPYSHAEIVPVDSEHSAIWQCLQAGRREDVSSVILTASGGPFLHASKEELACVTPTRALKHPNWNMGKRVTVDSATMMNKGLELIEAKWLFSLSDDEIEILVHPQSIIHSMVRFVDGACIAQLSLPSMELPISLALNAPSRVPTVPHVDFAKLGTLTFCAPDYERFPCLKIAKEVSLQGGLYPCAMNAADEVCVEAFLDGKISFQEIPAVIASVLDSDFSQSVSEENIRATDMFARKLAYNIIESR